MYTNTRRFSGRPQYGARRAPTYHRSARSNGHKQTLDPRRFVKPAKPVSTAEFTPKHQFSDFNINPLLKDNLARRGYVTPSPIQDEAIPLALTGRDIVGIANTGTGKTAAFALPVLNRLIGDRNAKVLIIAPTRELAEQIENECRAFARGSGLLAALVIGGTSMSTQIRELRQRPAIVIGTPGRLKDHVQRGTLELGGFNMLVLDEVDRMLDMGFIIDIRFLLDRLATPRQSFFFSATIDPKVAALTQTFLTNPVSISVKNGDTSDNVAQDVVHFNGKDDKLDKLHNALIHEKTKKTLIFGDTKRSVERLSEELQRRGFKAEAIHGGRSQGQRQRALAKFKQNEINVLVATDVAARGIDVIDITHVINYNLPNTYDDYAHRIGRAGRAGNPGNALTFVEA